MFIPFPSITKKTHDNQVRFFIYKIHDYFLKNKLDFEKYLTGYRLQKIIFDISEELDIPLSRSWYLYGGHVHSSLITKKEFIKIINQRDNYNNIKRQFLSQYPDYSEDFIDNILNSILNKIDFNQTGNYNPEFYDRAPPLYKDVYSVNNEIIDSLKSLVDKFFLDNTKNPIHSDDRAISNYKKISPLFSNLHLSSFKFLNLKEFNQKSNIDNILSSFSRIPGSEKINEYRVIILKYTLLFENIIIKSDSIPDDPLKLTKNKVKLLKNISNYYERYLWKPISLKISMDTIKGFNKDSIYWAQYKRLVNFLNDSESILNKLENLYLRNGLLCDSEDITRSLMEYNGY